MNPGRLILVCVAALVLTLARTAAAKQYVIDDFEAATSPSPWVFGNGPEFPGATGSLASGPGISGKGAALAYDFTNGGAYVEMTLTLPTPLDLTALGYAARASGVQTRLRVVDSMQQVFQYDESRPLEAGGPSDWYTIVVDLTAPTSYFGGPNDGVMHEPITAVSLLAGDALQPGLVGVVGFDSVVAWDTLAQALDPNQTPLPAPGGAGDLATRLGVNIHFTSDDQALDIIAGAGMSKVRMDLGWAGVETAMGVYDFSAFDALVAALAARGLTLHLILDYFNPLYPMPTDAGYQQTTVPAFAAVSKAVATHFVGKGLTYEVWNEENGSFWPPSANAAQYSALCAAAITAVHAGDPSALVTVGGLAGFDPAFLEAVLDAGGAAGTNAYGVHPYRQGGGESVTDDLAFMRQTITGDASAAAPVWDTEWGYSSQWYGGDAGGHSTLAWMLQAQRAQRELLSAWAVGFPMAIYYDIRDDGTDPTNDEDNFGLIQNDYADKPAIVAVRTLTSAAKGRTFTGFLPVGFTSTHAMLLVGATDRVVALWTDAPGSVVQVGVPGDGTATDMLGKGLSLNSEAGVTTVTVSEVAGPVFLTFPNPAVADAGMDAASVSDGAAPMSDGATPTADATTPADAAGASEHSRGGCGCHFVRSREEPDLSLVAGFCAFSAGITAARRRSRRRLNPRAQEAGLNASYG
jgi:hypothetical protein